MNSLVIEFYDRNITAAFVRTALLILKSVKYSPKNIPYERENVHETL